MIHNSPPLIVIDVVSLVAVLGTLAGEIPTIMGALAAIYYLLAICDLIRKWLKR